MFDYKTAIDSSKQVFDPTQGQKQLRQQPPVKFQSAAANQHFQDVYRPQGQRAGGLGRDATEAQNQYYLAAQKAQDQSVLSGLNLMAEKQANAYQRQAEADRLRYKFMDDIMGGATGLLGGLL
jgi:hypothetical protein